MADFITAIRETLGVHEPRLLRLWGSYGDLDVDLDTGDIVEYRPDEGQSAYDDIARFDTAELLVFIETPEGRHLEALVLTHRETDICDVGFWTHNGEYFPASEDSRRCKDND